MKIFRNKDKARKVAKGNEVVVKINGVYTIMTIDNYRKWIKQK